MGNPGPCGAGACISLIGVQEPVCLQKPVSTCGSILLGKMVEQMVLRFISHRLTNTESQMCEEFHMFSDSQSAMGMLTPARLAKMQEILIFPRTAGNTGNSRDLLGNKFLTN